MNFASKVLVPLWWQHVCPHLTLHVLVPSSPEEGKESASAEAIQGRALDYFAQETPF